MAKNRKKINRGNKSAIEQRFLEADGLYPLVEEIKEKNIYIADGFEYMFNYKLVIKVPGKVVADSRPRGIENIVNMRGHKYNPNKELLIKIFKDVYKDSLLEDLTIFSPLKFDIKIFGHMPKRYQDIHKKLKLEMYIPFVSYPDVDNVAKVFYDVMQDAKYQIIFNDNSIFDTRISKVYSEKEYVEMNIYFNKELSEFEEFILKESLDFLYYLISYKYIKKKIKPEAYVNYVRFKYNERKKTPNPKKLRSVLRNFPKEYLSEITNTNIAHAKQVDIVIDSIMKGDELIDNATGHGDNVSAAKHRRKA